MRGSVGAITATTTDSRKTPFGIQLIAYLFSPTLLPRERLLSGSGARRYTNFFSWVG